MAVPYTFGSATTSIPLSQLDSNFATTITLGNTAIQLGNTVTTLNNMTLGNVTISSGTSNIQTNVANATGVLLEANGGTGTTTGYYGFKNRIINGAMVIDQRNAGASITPTGEPYTVDRWRYQNSQSSKFSIQQNAGSVTPPAGFTNYLGLTSLSAYSINSTDIFVIGQSIEGFNVADLGWGTANAQTITISFWVRSSLTGTFGGSIFNAANDRSYPYTYTISSANTWEKKSITVAGDTSGTWLTTNGKGMQINWGLGNGSAVSGTAGSWSGNTYWSATGATSVVGTNGATFYITGVQLEKGSTATSFDYRPYTTELCLCQRYYYKIKANDGGTMFGSGFVYNGTSAVGLMKFGVTMRIAPTALEQTGTAGDYRVFVPSAAITCTGVPTFDGSCAESADVQFNTANVLTAGQGIFLRAVSSTSYLAWSAEL